MIQYLKLSLIARHTVEILKMEGWIVKRFCDMCLNWYSHPTMIRGFNRLEATVTKTFK